MGHHPTHRDFDPEKIPLRQRHQLLLSGVAPRPIAFVGSMSDKGDVNLAPFSFFNAFGANPAYVAFSPSLRGADGSSKDTLRNVLSTGEYTISVVSHAMVPQVNIASAEYPYGTDEFVKSGFTKLPSVKVAPPGVKESPFVMECRHFRHIELGGKAGSGNLMVGEVVFFRVREDVIDDHGRLDPAKMDPVGRMGYDWYTRALPGLFELPKPEGCPIGYDSLPSSILHSTVLTGAELSILTQIPVVPVTLEAQAEIDGRLRDLSETALHEEIRKGLHDRNQSLVLAIIDLVKKRQSSHHC